MRIGELIAKYRSDNNLSLRKFAEACDNISYGYIKMLENGENPSTGKKVVPSIDKMEAIAKGMGITIQELLEMLKDDSEPIKVERTRIVLEPANLSSEDEAILSAFHSLNKTGKAAALAAVRSMGDNIHLAKPTAAQLEASAAVTPQPISKAAE